MPSTRAPISLASCKAKMETPPVPDQNRCPGFRLPAASASGGDGGAGQRGSLHKAQVLRQLHQAGLLEASELGEHAVDVAAQRAFNLGWVAGRRASSA